MFPVFASWLVGLKKHIHSLGKWTDFKKNNSTQLLIQFSCSVVSDSLQPHGLQYSRLPCPSPTLRACSDSCSLSQWCHPTISSSVIPFSSRFQSFPASGSFPMSQLFASGGQVMEFQLQHQSFQWIFRVDIPKDWLVRSPCCSRDAQESSPAP